VVHRYFKKEETERKRARNGKIKLKRTDEGRKNEGMIKVWLDEWID
jgi:hypothetical protein